ncbi:MAG: hypothetical protein KatS3mg063_1262 [Tepidiforma sp.]|jgi:hypothetical protein|uniref:DUF4175 domain-containing protein n=1 Tax=Tepidiforma bonchosmolovskayae TaxID=2601677 RepID=A0ABX6C5L8_9CHLR|nr:MULTISPECIES: hypothetical protein [Tepidiforma]QFG04119.1 hypothetical protein Tbon_12810 [Tepidiforma bonchosmolovskayae]GIW15409.1 MAG: hypothetical protein KatS3mg063_1262 [Tepidiforma sp.]
MYTAIFVGLYLAGWATLAFLPWLGWSVATRGRAGLWNLPLCLAAGVTAGLAVPLLGATGWGGFWLSFALAFVVPLGLLAARHWARLPQPAASPAPGRPPQRS